LLDNALLDNALLDNALLDNALLDNALLDNALLDNVLTNDLVVEDNVLVAEVEKLFITPSLKKEKKQKTKIEFDIIDDNIEEEVTP
jgi:uncharacterized protein YjbI with pentapeptide repeats